MRVHKECMYPSATKNLKELTGAILRWENKWNTMMSEPPAGTTIPESVREQVYLRIDEIGEDYDVMRNKVLGWVSNKVE